MFSEKIEKISANNSLYPLNYSTFANKWEFEQMGRFAENALQLFREQMGIRTNGKICSDFFKQKTKWEDFSENVVQRGSF